MGPCASGMNKERKDSYVFDTFDLEPQDTQSFRNQTLPDLSFSAQLTKIKVKRCIYPSISMKFSILDVEEFLLPTKQVSSQVAKWDIEHVFRFHMNEYQMRKKFIILTFYDKSSVEIGSLKINLYLLATGPFHQDFALSLLNDSDARVSFNLKIAQIIKMKFQFLEAQMIPIEKEYPGDKFTFSVRSIMGHNTQYTNQSYVLTIAFDDDDENQRKNQSPKLLQMKKKVSRKIVSNSRLEQIEVDRNHIKWSKSISPEMPCFVKEIALFDMHSSAFHIIYWKLNKTTDKNNDDNVTAQSFVSINKLLNFQSKVVFDQTMIQYEQRQIKIQQKNYLHGKEVGMSSFKMKFSIQKHIKQMQVCVRTQQGILKGSPVFSRQDSKTAVNKQITSLAQLSAKIDTQFILIAKNRKQNGSTLQLRRSIQNIIKSLTSQKQILTTTVKESTMFFNYKDEKQLLKSQEELIQISFKTRNYINQNIDDISTACFILLFVMMKRGELTLAYIGFNQENSQRQAEFKVKKVYIALKYQQLLNQLIALALSSLNFKGHESQKQFAQLFCAVAYFRIPSFRKHVLKAISRDDDPQIQEWRGTEFNLYDNEDKIQFTGNQQKNTYEIFFDWENNFYKHFEHQERYKKNDQQLQIILINNQWQDRIKKRRGAFFAFIKYWCNYVESIAVNSRNLKWKHFPGYNKILHAFLVEMKSKQLSQYSDRMQNACVGLLNNERLLNTFVAIIYKKSDINSPASILKLLDYLQLFFATIDKKNRVIPTTFDYSYMFKGFKMIFDTPHCYSLGKALLLLYNNFNIFSPDFKYSISLYLMGKLFFRLFLHWSQNVRTIFHHLLYIRINKMTQFNIKNKGFTRKERMQLRERYDKLMIILENANVIKKKISKTVQSRYQKEYYKKMKRKLYNKKNNNKVKEQTDDYDVQATMKALGNIPRKNSAFDQRIIDQLAKPKLERYNSEVMSRNLKIAIQVAETKKDQIIRLKTSKKASTQEDDDILPVRKQSLDEKQIKRINLLTEQQSQIWQMTLKQSEYIAQSLTQYGSIHQLFLKHLAKSNNLDSVPIVKLQISYDYEDIRPQGVDQW